MISRMTKLLCLTGLLMPAIAECAQRVTWEHIVAAVTEVEITPPQLDFNSVMAQKVSTDYLQKQMSSIAAAINKLKLFQAESSCQKIILPMLHNALKAQSLHTKLLEAQVKNQQSYQGSIYQLSNGEQWYQYLTMSWLGEAIGPDELFQVGAASFDKAIVELRKLDHQLNMNQTKNRSVSSIDDETIKSYYKKAEQAVTQNLEQQFNSVKGVAELKVNRSLQGMGFPAPGYYNSSNQTMYYNPMGADYDLHQVEWLYLHEGIPGHHYQGQVAAINGICLDQELNDDLVQGQMAFVEGWAAYVETIGKSIGLLKDPRSHRYVLFWEALRAMRVMTDVGIHSKGWSDEHARNHWSGLFPEGLAVMSREMTRIKNWPMQVNTYVYGKHKIEQLKQLLIKNKSDDFDIRTFHQNLLQVSHFPIHVLNQYSELFNTKEYLQ